MRIRSLGFVTAILAVTALLTVPTYANVVFTLGNSPQSNEENILFSMDQSASTVTGTGNTSALMVDFSSTTDTLMTTADGQAQVTSSDGLINDLSIWSSGNSFTDLIFNPENGTGMADVVVTASNGSFNFSYPLGNGNNFLTITTTGGETISKVTIDDTAGFPDVKQPRVSGLAAAAAPVPEASTLLLSLVSAFGVSVLGYRKKCADFSRSRLA